MSRASLLFFCLLCAATASGASLNIPSANGPLTVDGLIDEDIWKQAVVLPLQSLDFGAPFPAGGEMRAVVREGYLCLSARLPETGRIIARSIGRNPAWWREDLVIWTFRFHSSEGRNVSLTLSVNPLGAYSVEPTVAAEDPQQSIRASAFINSESWSAEVAIPVAKLAKAGFVSVERIRVPRPNAAELRWYWPGANDRLDFQLALGASSQPPPPVVTKDWRFSAPPAAPVTSTDPVALDLASVPGQVWTDEERKNLSVEEMWEANLRSRAMVAALAERRD